MSKAIYKYQLNKSGITQVRMPVGAKILSASAQSDQLVIHALVSTIGNTSTEIRDVEAVMTGQYLSADMSRCTYIDTVVFTDEVYVVHVFEY